MINDDWNEFDRELKITCEAFDRRHSKELGDAYWSALEKMQIQTFRRACKFAREHAGKDGMDRLPKPGRFWSLSEDARRAEKPQRQALPAKSLLTKEHLAHLHRAAIDCAKRETMPTFKGTISRNVPDAFQKDFDEKWRVWDSTLGKMDDSYWLPQAQQLMRSWGAEVQTQKIKMDDVFGRFP